MTVNVEQDIKKIQIQIIVYLGVQILSQNSQVVYATLANLKKIINVNPVNPLVKDAQILLPVFPV